MDIPQGAIPIDQFEADTSIAPSTVPPDAIPVDQFVSQDQVYSTPGQQIKAGLEGLARGIAGPLATAIEKNYYHVPAEDIRARQEANPGTAMLGETAGLVGGTITGTGEAAVLETIGKAAAEATGLTKTAGYASRVGSSIVKNAAEMAAYQSGDEISKMILDDPNAGAQSAITNIGLSALLGAGTGAIFTGAISPLWKATVGSDVAQGLKAMVSRMGGIEGDVAANTADQLAAKAGVEIPTEVRSVLNEQPMARESHSILSQDDSSIAGRAYQKKLQDLDAQMGVRTAEALGKTPEDILNIPEKNNYESGQKLGEMLHEELKPIVEDISNKYDNVTEQFKAKPISTGVMRSMGDELADKSISEGWTKSFDDANSNLVNKILDKLPEQATINDLKQSISNLYRAFDAPDFRAALEAKKILTKGLESAITEHMGPKELLEYNALRKAYSSLSDHLESLDSHLHLGKWNGPKTFLNALKEKANTKGETLLSNIMNKNNANLLDLLKNHPKTLNEVIEHYKNELIRSATKNPAPGELIKTGKLLKDISELSPQQKALVINPASHERLEAISAIKEGLKDPTHNFSNTARTLRKHMAGAVSPTSLIAMLLGHGEVGILSYLGGLGLHEVRPGMKLGLLKMMGSTNPVSAEGFAAASGYFTAAQKGAKILNTAAENVFKPGSKVLLPSQMPKASDIQKLDRLVASNDPETNNHLMNNQNNHIGHYAPEHQTALSQSSLQALQYLRSIKPTAQQLSPLEPPTKPMPMQEARYHRALEIAQQPAIVLQHVKDGTLQASDIQDLHSMYPELYNQLSQKLSSSMINHASKDKIVPYHTKMSLSLFLGQPLDSTMTPGAIMAAQPKPAPIANPGVKMASPKRGGASLGKGNKQYMTPNQAAESDKAKRD